MICRICKNNPLTANEHKGDRLLKYAVRSYAHYRCWLQYNVMRLPNPKTTHAIGELLMTLHERQLRELPVLGLADVLESYGLRTRATDLLRIIRMKRKTDRDAGTIEGVHERS